VAVFPLKGVRVISLTEVWAGPFATSLLGDMGADVLHIEAIQRVAQKEVPLPYSADLERSAIPSVEDVIRAVKRVM